MKIKIIFDNEVLNSKFSIGWGFSCLVGEDLLFDTGESAESLLNNMRQLDINLSKIKDIVISHDHWDHTGGLWKILEKNKSVRVWGCPGFSRNFKNRVKSQKINLIEAKNLMQIRENIFTTGEIQGKYHLEDISEQSLVVKTSKGLVVITGCSHPGIVKILEQVRNYFPQDNFYLVFGGFHLLHKDLREVEMIVSRFKEMKVQLVGPTHCTGLQAKELFKKMYKNNFLSIKAGKIIEL